MTEQVTDMLCSYENLLNYVEEVRDSLVLLEQYFINKPDDHDDKILRPSYAALLQLATRRLDDLMVEHYDIVAKETER